MALHPDFPESPHAILDPSVRWFPADETLREMTRDKLMPPRVAALRRKVKEFRDDDSGPFLRSTTLCPHPSAPGPTFVRSPRHPPRPNAGRPTGGCHWSA